MSDDRDVPSPRGGKVGPVVVLALFAALMGGLYLHATSPGVRRAAREHRCQQAVGTVNLSEVNIWIMEHDARVGSPSELAQQAAYAEYPLQKQPECFAPGTPGAIFSGDLASLDAARSCASDSSTCTPQISVPRAAPRTAPPLSSAPPGATFLCRDYTWSYAWHSQGACSWHGGIYESVR